MLDADEDAFVVAVVVKEELAVLSVLCVVLLVPFDDVLFAVDEVAVAFTIAVFVFVVVVDVLLVLAVDEASFVDALVADEVAVLIDGVVLPVSLDTVIAGEELAVLFVL